MKFSLKIQDKALKKYKSDTERDNFMQAEEAKKYGLIDNILTSRE